MNSSKAQEQNYANVGELLKDAKKREGEQNQEKPKGLEFMALRFNVLEKRRQLRFFKQVTPSEYYLLEEIELATIGGQNSKNTICSSTELFIKDLAAILGVGLNKVYVNLKSLHAKGLIIRQSTRSPGREIIGLDPKAFGQIIIDSQFELEKRRHLRVVENYQNHVENSPADVPPRDKKSPKDESNMSQTGTNLGPKEDKNGSQAIDNIEEKVPLDSPRNLLDSFKRQKTKSKEGEELHSLGQGTGSKTNPIADLSNPEAIEAEKKRQLEAFRRLSLA